MLEISESLTVQAVHDDLCPGGLATSGDGRFPLPPHGPADEGPAETFKSGCLAGKRWGKGWNGVAAAAAIIAEYES